MKRPIRVIMVLFAVLGAAVVLIDVQAESTADHHPIEDRAFQVDMEVEISAPRERVFRALTKEIDRWWPRRFRPGGSEVILEPHPGGRVFEDWGKGLGALYATVTFLDPPSQLRLSGPMGGGGASHNGMIYSLEARGERTVLRYKQYVVGDVSILSGPTVEERIEIGLNALKEYVEQGTRFRP